MSSELYAAQNEPSDDADVSKTDQHTIPRSDHAPVKPFIKWAGGKTRLLQKLLPHVPEQVQNYYEPFLGGGAMFFAIRDRISGSAFLSDLNHELINTWVVVRDRASELNEVLSLYHSRDSKDFYYSERSRQPEGDIDGAARFLYLNQTAWNGLWRVNRRGEYNVPWGQRPFRGFKLGQLRRLQAVLAATELSTSDFRAFFDRPEPGDFVYLDPPYLPLSETSKFHLYTEKRFREPDLRELAEWCEQLSARGVGWVLSNRDTPLVRDLFSHAQVFGLTTRRSVAAQNRRDVEAAASPEVIIVGRGLYGG